MLNSLKQDLKPQLQTRVSEYELAITFEDFDVIAT